MVTVLMMSTMFLGLATLAGSMAYSSHDDIRRERDNIRVRLAADEALSMAIEENQTGTDVYGGGIGVLRIVSNDITLETTSTSLGSNLYRINASATGRMARAGVSAVILQTPAGAIAYNARAAVAARSSISTSGSIEIDGRDWNSTGTAVVGSGTYGMSSTSTITNGGNSKVGGNGVAPAKPVPAVAKQASATWADGINNDGDGSTDEEAYDGIDNDGDGKTDEDTTGYPAGPDVALGLAVGTLKARAIAQGTYFTTSAAFQSAITANGGIVPGGKIIFLDFQTYGAPASLGSAFNDPPSIIVHHRSTNDASMKNVHGFFKGLIIADVIDKVNANANILGGFLLFGTTGGATTFGNGNARICYSSNVLSNLPATASASSIRVISRGRAASF